MMDPRYAAFIWISYGLTAALVLWNVVAPWRTRNELKQTLSERHEDESAEDSSP